MFKITSASICIDCKEPLKLREFYAKLTGWDKDPNADEYSLISDTGMNLYFMGCDFDYIPPVWPEEPGKQQKQMHFDFCVDDLTAAEEYAISLGATKTTEPHSGFHVVLLDPEGHPFCLIDPKLHPYAQAAQDAQVKQDA